MAGVAFSFTSRARQAKCSSCPIQIALRAVAAKAGRTRAQGKRGTTLPAFGRIAESPGKRVLCSRRDARTQARPQTSEDRIPRWRESRSHLRAEHDRRSVRRARSKSRYEPLPPKPAEPVPKENAEQLFRRLVESQNPPANACYVLAAMLERKRVLKQVKTESRDGGSRVLIYEQSTTGEVFVVPDPNRVTSRCRQSRPNPCPRKTRNNSSGVW